MRINNVIESSLVTREKYNDGFYYTIVEDKIDNKFRLINLSSVTILINKYYTK